VCDNMSDIFNALKIKLMLRSGVCANHVNYHPVRSIYTVSITVKAHGTEPSSAYSQILAIST